MRQRKCTNPTVTARPLLVLVSTALFMGAVRADSIDISGQEPWESCSYCHGFDGVSASERFPHLAGQQKAYLKTQLQYFRSGVRTNDEGVMQTNAATLSESDIEQVTEYFSGQPLPGSAASESDSALGGKEGAQAAALYRDGQAGECPVPACKSCHGEQARGSGGIPALAGQHSAYLSKQLADFASAQRGHSAQTMDHSFVGCLSSAQQQQLSQFLNRK